MSGRRITYRQLQARQVPEQGWQGDKLMQQLQASILAIQAAKGQMRARLEIVPRPEPIPAKTTPPSAPVRRDAPFSWRADEWKLDAERLEWQEIIDEQIERFQARFHGRAYARRKARAEARIELVRQLREDGYTLR